MQASTVTINFYFQLLLLTSTVQLPLIYALLLTATTPQFAHTIGALRNMGRLELASEITRAGLSAHLWSPHNIFIPVQYNGHRRYVEKNTQQVKEIDVLPGWLTVVV